LRYRDPARALDWLCAAFGFEPHHIVRAADGIISYGQLALGNSMVMIGRVGDAGFDALMKQPDEVDGAETQISYFVIADVDAHYERATAAGAAIVLSLGDYDQGGRGYSCRDPEGHVWSFGSFDPWPSKSAASPTFVEPKGWRARLAVATVVIVALAGGVAGGWMLTVSSSYHGMASTTPDAALRLADYDQDVPTQRDLRPAEEVFEAQALEAEARRLAGIAEQKAAHLDQLLQAAVAAKDAATRAVTTLERELKAVVDANVTTEEQASQLAMQLEKAHATAANIDQRLRETGLELEKERASSREAARASEHQRQYLLEQLAVAEAARQLATDRVEDLSRSQPPMASIRATAEAREEPGRTVIAPKVRRQAAGPVRRQVTSTESSQRARLRHRCAEIRGDPDAYDKALVDLCGTL
jgi:uncharacterized glyoxalase superfamily protein PhnB